MYTFNIVGDGRFFWTTVETSDIVGGWHLPLGKSIKIGWCWWLAVLHLLHVNAGFLTESGIAAGMRT
jgi:hypothetical protein